MIMIEGFCPVCGGQTLGVVQASVSFPAKVECTNINCTNIYAVAQILAVDEINHVVHFHDQGFSIRHPLRERIDDELLRCNLHNYLAEFAPNELGFEYEVGTFRAWSDGEGENFAYHFEKVGTLPT